MLYALLRCRGTLASYGITQRSLSKALERILLSRDSIKKKDGKCQFQEFDALQGLTWESVCLVCCVGVHGKVFYGFTDRLSGPTYDGFRAFCSVSTFYMAATWPQSSDMDSVCQVSLASRLWSEFESMEESAICCFSWSFDTLYGTTAATNGTKSSILPNAYMLDPTMHICMSLFGTTKPLIFTQKAHILNAWRHLSVSW